MTRREKVALANIAGVLAGWLLALAAVALILSLQAGLNALDDKAQHERKERQARAEHIDYSQLEARACQMTACERMK